MYNHTCNHNESLINKIKSKSRRTFEIIISIWRNPNTQNSTNLRIHREPSKELAEPLGSAEPRLKNTDIDNEETIYVNPENQQSFQ